VEIISYLNSRKLQTATFWLILCFQLFIVKNSHPLGLTVSSTIALP
jgi:hypothetical protein